MTITHISGLVSRWPDGNPAAAAEHLALAAAMRPDLPHYTNALRGVRATLRARAAPEPPGPPPAGDGPG